MTRNQTPASPIGRGGARKGAGRKTSALPPDVVARIGVPPASQPLAMARWWAKTLAETGWLVIQGRVSPALVDRIRALAATAAKIIPGDVLAEANRILTEDDRERDADDSPDVEEARGGGPQLRGA